MTINPPPNEFREPILYHKLELLFVCTHQRVLRFPKLSRHTLGVRIENIILEIVELSYSAITKQGQSRLLILTKIDVLLKVLQHQLRSAHRLKCLNDAGMAELSEKVVEISRIFGGWILKTKNSDS